MRKTKQNGHFLLWLCINMLLNWKGLIPAAILLALHACFHISLWWSLIAACVWLLHLILWMAVIRWAKKCGSVPSPPQKNKNPYSAGKYQNKNEGYSISTVNNE